LFLQLSLLSQEGAVKDENLHKLGSEYEMTVKELEELSGLSAEICER